MFEKKYDIVVAGGGVAGVAAALAAARRGKKVALIEKNVFTGGLATAGLVLVYLPLCDGYGHQVSFGITEELMRLANEYGPVGWPTDWQQGGKGKRLEVYFSPASMVLAFDKALEASGVDLWFDTMVIGTQLDDDRKLKSVQVANSSGLGTISAEMFVDATGNGVLAHLSGNACLESDNALVTWVIEHRERMDSTPYNFGQNITTSIIAEPLSKPSTPKGINGKMVSDFLLNSRRKYRKLLDQDYADGVEDRRTRFPLALPCMVPLRHSRCIKGKYVLMPEDQGKSFQDSIGLAADWRSCGKVWEIPYASLLPDNVGNLLGAGRCSSAFDDAWEVTRVIPVAAMTGEVAGVAASLSLDSGTSPATLEYGLLARELREKCGFPLKFSEVGLDYTP